jgi:Lantibiotic dehydratase, N terminus
MSEAEALLHHEWTFCDLAIFRSAGFPTNCITRLVPPNFKDLDYRDRRSRCLVELRAIARDPRFCEAVWLNSSQMFKRLQDVETKAIRITRLDRKLYGYLQRFCLKNDTISLFGPIGYLFVEEAAPYWPKAMGADRSRRQAVLAHWVCEVLAEAIARDDRIAPDIPIRLSPFAPRHVDKDVSRSVAFVLRALLRAPANEPRSHRMLLTEVPVDEIPDVNFVLHRLETAGLVQKSIAVHPISFDGLQSLRDALSNMPYSIAVGEWLDYLSVLSEELHAIGESTGLESKISAAARLRDKLSNIVTMVDWERSEGQPDRRGFFEDALLGESPILASPALFKQIGASLQPCLSLMAARAMVKQGCWRRWALELLKRRNEDHAELPLTRFALIVAEAVNEGANPDFERLQAFDAQLATLLRRPVPTDSIVLDPQDIAAFLEHWSLPQFAVASPDIFLIKAEGKTANQPLGSVVIGEVHGTATVWGCLLRFAPQDRIDSLRRRLATWLDNLPVVPCEFMLGRRKGRTFLLDLPCPAVEFAHRTGGHATASLLPNDVWVNLSEGGPHVRAESFEKPLTFVRSSWTGPLADILAVEVESFPIVLGHHTPRITVGPVVLQRARWDMNRDRLLVPLSLGTDDLVSKATVLRVRHGFPRHIYVKTLESEKSFYVDLENDVAIDYLRAALRAARMVTVHEALPEPGCHSIEIEGEVVSSEIRMTAFFRS